ncbi:hypothetical protein [Paraburkholderia sp. MM5482-R1]|uniref:hypothetical protein n=1 Tax=unclassified Paraburkholderia TaxID=2615204 RepID=UPI003D262E05
MQCGYHGLVFDMDGKCVKNPFGATPENVRVHSYPVVERHRCVCGSGWETPNGLMRA